MVGKLYFTYRQTENQIPTIFFVIRKGFSLGKEIRGSGAGWAGWAFAHPVFREQNRKSISPTTLG